MKIIARCPFCRQKVRFPINKGKLLIRCPQCNNQFLFDPDLKKMLMKTIGIIKTKFFQLILGIKSKLRKR